MVMMKSVTATVTDAEQETIRLAAMLSDASMSKWAKSVLLREAKAALGKDDTAKSAAAFRGGMEVLLTSSAMKNIGAEAAKRGIAPASLAGLLLETISESNLFLAVLDDAPENGGLIGKAAARCTLSNQWRLT